jgi:hypothetical protein
VAARIGASTSGRIQPIPPARLEELDQRDGGLAVAMPEGLNQDWIRRTIDRDESVAGPIGLSRVDLPLAHLGWNEAEVGIVRGNTDGLGCPEIFRMAKDRGAGRVTALS